MDLSTFDMGPVDIAWCPGCGNFPILKALKAGLAELGVSPEGLVLVSGIGQAAKLPHYLKSHFFCGLHGRALPVATGVKGANPSMKVIAVGGDGDMYGEGGNHFLAAIRRNPDITHLVHDNMVYGLTKGQASPTSLPGFKTPVQVEGVTAQPFNPLAVAIALNASFVARASAADPEGLRQILKAAIAHRGYALVDIFQPCVSFNKLNSYQWFRDHTVPLGDEHDPTNRMEAFRRAVETDPLPTGIFYVEEGRPTFTDHLPAYRGNDLPLFRRTPDPVKLQSLIASMRLP